MNTIPQGSVSHGTMRNVDLIESFMDMLRHIGEDKMHDEWKIA